MLDPIQCRSHFPALSRMHNGRPLVYLDGPGGISKFQPMNINYGLLPPLEAPKVDEAGVKIPLKERGRAKKRLMSVRALEALKAWRDSK